MTTFDKILPVARGVLEARLGTLDKLEWLLINRDLNSRVRLIAPATVEADQALQVEILALASALAAKLGPHAYPPEASVLFEESRELASEGGSTYALDGFSQVWVVDRLATEADWSHIAPESSGAPRVVFSRSREAWDVPLHWQPQHGTWRNPASACWYWILISNPPACPRHCCRPSANPPTALPTG